MRIETTLQPGAPGTKRLVDRFGERLVCVRYRLDARTGRRCKTVELIVNETLSRPDQDGNELVWLRVAYEESDLRKQVKSAGGRWHRGYKLWQLHRRHAVALGLASRIVPPSQM